MAMKVISQFLPEELIKEVEKIAKMEERNRSEVIRRAVSDYIERYNEGRKDL